MSFKFSFKSLLVIFLAWFIVHEICVIADGLNNENEKAEFAVIFGTTVNRDGTLSARLKARLNAGLKLYRTGLVDKVYVSGGLGKEGYYEATEMKKYLTLAGLDTAKVYVDNRGTNTRLTSLNFMSDFSEVQSVVVVSQYFHVTRAKLAFKKLGVTQVTGASADYFEWRDVYSTVREFFAYYWYLCVY